MTVERPLTLYLNGQEIVTMMTIGDYPEYLALGYLLNQNMLRPDDEVTGVEYDDDEELQGGAEISDRDRHRWELDPSSKDDFDETE